MTPHGAVLVYGGQLANFTPIGIFWMYAPGSDTWFDGKIYVVGGRTGSGFSNTNSTNVSANEAYRTHEVYDPGMNAWQTLPPMLTPRHGFATAELGGRIYAVSGVNVAGGGGPAIDLTANEVYEP